ncbi:tRNA (adenosine(37)-N6)-threonylcarbamoyltransferase complex transferase subunit TsaD [Rhodopirellula sp. MGV]|uniref:tRNA (adenosine(37)-N6)-threonylcarbamoyltransferase complex transferase subunit TsaD n=1 Tax=Rhodopirellula sp. MGV TaxID=2023130 RepID=UPI000B96916C|nr:tRNA (adenosine(37)-N6)-threonylcarbamoyltransferase complex transferase subunit TsaD [Rhodopirellula sp. MGV]OYP38887.1 tRNA (adenosine(37)-N6)-threonylcarbamoyltransferase complex transferase subunit TsaD [Rhodopirellula sp. MGV]PNY38300.1 tRNA (adenosine(37)-N6)-threonylcarbamoyltransferase complex transferase subunit TsaD [Rhodopirellula baltica]
MTILTLESTCDETAAAVISDSGAVLGQCIATQETLHERFGGVVPEVAARAHLERILPVIDTAIVKSGVSVDDLSAIAVADRPGLAGSLLVGVVAAKTLAVAWQKPLVSINHLHAHLYACQMASEEAVYPSIGLVVSGGHTSLYHCTSPLDLEYLGGTIDDAAGEAFDKVGAMLDLGFPGGPAVSKLAQQGNPKAHDFPRSMIGAPDYRFSFSGLKTAVRYTIAPPPAKTVSASHLDQQAKADICASFQAAVVAVLVRKSTRAVKEYKTSHLIVGGGVAANPELRRQLQAAADKHGFRLVIAPPELCTDNAAMGAIALEKVRRGEYAELDLDITAGLQRGY